MNGRGLTESVIEEAALGWLEAVGWRAACGPEIAPDMITAERSDFGEVLLAQRNRSVAIAPCTASWRTG